MLFWMMPWSLLLGVPLAPVVADAGAVVDATKWVPVLVTLAANVALVSVWAGRIGERVESMRAEHLRMYVALQNTLSEIKADMYTRKEAEARWQTATSEHAAFDKRITRLEDHEDA